MILRAHQNKDDGVLYTLQIEAAELPYKVRATFEDEVEAYEIMEFHYRYTAELYFDILKKDLRI